MEDSHYNWTLLLGLLGILYIINAVNAAATEQNSVALHSEEMIETTGINKDRYDEDYFKMVGE